MSRTIQKYCSQTGSRKDNGNFKSFGCEVRKKGCASAKSISRSFCSLCRPVPSWSSLTEPDGSLSLLVLVHSATRFTSIRFPAFKRARRVVRGTVNEKNSNSQHPSRGPLPGGIKRLPLTRQDARACAKVLPRTGEGAREAHVSSHPLPCSESFNEPARRAEGFACFSLVSVRRQFSPLDHTFARPASKCSPHLSLFRVSS